MPFLEQTPELSTQQNLTKKLQYNDIKTNNILSIAFSGTFASSANDSSLVANVTTCSDPPQCKKGRIMKLNVFSLLVLFPLFSSTVQAQVYGCGTIPSDPNKVWIYSGPTSAGSDQARYLPGSYKFKAEEKGSFTSSGHTAYWALFKAPTYASPASAFSKVEGPYTSSFGVLDRKSDRVLTASSSGYYCAVVTSAHYNSCNNHSTTK